MNSNEFLTVAEAAARVNATVRQLRRRIHAGLLAAIRPPGARQYLVRAADLYRLYTPVLTAPPRLRETEKQKWVRRLANAGFVPRSR